MSTKGFEPLKLYPLLASAITHVHPGTGRSPGVVDLPVIRDSLGYYFIPGSSLKGSLKSFLGKIKECIDSNGKIACNKDGDCKKICCLFGGEPGEGAEAPSRLSVTDLYPLLIPLPSLDKGIIFTTSPLLLSKLFMVLDVGGKSRLRSELNDLIAQIKDVKKGNAVYFSDSDNECPYVLTSRYEKCSIKSNGSLSNLINIIKGINKAYETLGLENRILVVPEEYMRQLMEKSLVKVTRIRLNRRTKTVESRALWSEEYIPHMALFSGAFVDTKVSGTSYCTDVKGDAIEELINLLNVKDRIIDLIIGGKETIGKGILRLSINLG